MSRLKVQAFALSVDGFGAGPEQSLQHPLGVGGMALHQWMFHTRTFARMHGGEGGDTGIDDAWARRSFEGIGAWILGRNMFGPLAAQGLRCARHQSSEYALHVLLNKE